MRTRLIGLWAAIAHIAFALTLANAANDCVLGERYKQLANDRIAAYENEEAMAYLEQSISACPTYEAYRELANLATQSPAEEDKRRAIAAFVGAHSLAPDDAARADVLFEYSKLLKREGDPQNAYPLIMEARALKPGDQEIARLAANIQHEVEQPTEEVIMRGLSDSLYQPLTVSGSAAAASTAVAAATPPPAMQGPSVNIPINFESGTAVVDARTRSNVRILARALTGPELAGKRFLFVGHADERGEADNNMALSKRRAETIHQSVILMEPSLEGRIDVIGRGEYDPIDPRSNEEAWRVNRRLQVILK